MVVWVVQTQGLHRYRLWSELFGKKKKRQEINTNNYIMSFERFKYCSEAGSVLVSTRIVNMIDNSFACFT